LKLDEMLLVYVDDVSSLVKNINTIKNAESLLDTSKDVGLETNAEKLCVC